MPAPLTLPGTPAGAPLKTPSAAMPMPSGAPAGAPQQGGLGAPRPGGAGPAKGGAATDPIMKIVSMDASSALQTAAAMLGKVGTLTVGGGTPEGTKAAAGAAQLLTMSSMLVQQGRVKLAGTGISAQLDANLMLASTKLASTAPMVASAGSSKSPIAIGEKLAPQVKQVTDVIATALATLQKQTKESVNPSAGGYL